MWQSWPGFLLKHAALAAVFGVLLVLVTPLPGDETGPPLHRRIDLAIESAHPGPSAGPAPDADFVRRCYLDLQGRIPTIAETREFLADPSPVKRAALIDRLLAGDEFNDFFAVVLDVMLMERRRDNRVSTGQWRQYLRESLAERKAFDQLAREILAADGTDAPDRAAAKFHLDRDVETHALTRDVSRMFFGRDVQCAQCHDHPIVDDYLQSEYFGVFAFLNRSFLFEDPKDEQKAYVGERAEGGAEFVSVFDPDADKTKAVPRLVDGWALDAEPIHDADAAYMVKPAKDARPVPTFSRRRQLARLATRADSRAFARNIVNRLWKHMLGRGIVEPVDFHHPDNPPSHPELLQLLADEFANGGFGIRELLRQIALSRAYQRSIDAPEWAPTGEPIAAALEQLSEQADREDTLLGRLRDQLGDYNRALFAERRSLNETDEALAAARTRIEKAREAQQAVGPRKQEIEQQLTAKRRQAKTLKSAADNAQRAAEALEDDQELVAIQAKLAERSRAIDGEVKSLEKSLAQLEDEARNAAEALGKETKQLNRLRAERLVQADLVAEARGARRVARSRYLRQVDALSELRQRHEAAQQLAEHEQRTTDVAAIRAERDTSLAELGPARDRLAAAEQAIVQARNQLRDHQQTLRAAETAVTESSQRIEQHRQLLLTLRQARQKTRDAASQLGAGELSVAIDALEARIADVEAKLRSAVEHSESCQARAENERRLLPPLETELAEKSREADQLRTVVAQRAEQIETAQQQLAAAEAALDASRANLVQAWTRRFAIKALKPLTPEQLAFSLITSLGLQARFQREAEAEWQSKNKDRPPEEVDEARKEAEIVALREKRLDGVEATFVSMFAEAPASPQDVFNSTVDQALFLANDGRVRGWLQPVEGTLVHRLKNEPEAGDVARQLYLAALSRPPTNGEISAVEDYLAGREGSRVQALQELTWGLLTSVEFRFNH